MTETPTDPVAWIVPELGEAPLRELVAAFYRRIPADDLLGPMYPADDLVGAEKRLADFLVERCGGPPHFSSERGHPRLRMRHARFKIDELARDRWLQLMTEASDEIALDARVRESLDPFLAHVADFLRNQA